MNEWQGDCRTAPATPGLLNKQFNSFKKVELEERDVEPDEEDDLLLELEDLYKQEVIHLDDLNDSENETYGSDGEPLWSTTELLNMTLLWLNKYNALLMFLYVLAWSAGRASVLLHSAHSI